MGSQQDLELESESFSEPITESDVENDRDARLLDPTLEGECVLTENSLSELSREDLLEGETDGGTNSINDDNDDDDDDSASANVETDSIVDLSNDDQVDDGGSLFDMLNNGESRFFPSLKLFVSLCEVYSIVCRLQDQMTNLPNPPILKMKTKMMLKRLKKKMRSKIALPQSLNSKKLFRRNKGLFPILKSG